LPKKGTLSFTDNRPATDGSGMGSVNVNVCGDGGTAGLPPDAVADHALAAAEQAEEDQGQADEDEDVDETADDAEEEPEDGPEDDERNSEVDEGPHAISPLVDDGGRQVQEPFRRGPGTKGSAPLALHRRRREARLP
jgi:hypothetical protein